MSTVRARRLRQLANVPEQRAWEALRILRRHGFAVRRQHPIGRDIVDFAILKARLVIGVDGGIHTLEGVQARDRERDARLELAGWRVLRLPAKAAMSEDALLAAVVPALRALDDKGCSPLPSGRGEGVRVAPPSHNVKR